jgi:hypothetical protein
MLIINCKGAGNLLTDCYIIVSTYYIIHGLKWNKSSVNYVNLLMKSVTVPLDPLLTFAMLPGIAHSNHLWKLYT